MIKYKVFGDNPEWHFFRFEAIFPTRGKDILELNLPIWRPGRYQFGNFARNIRKLNIADENGKDVPFSKSTSHSWKVECSALSQVIISYEFFANEFDAGNSWLDSTQWFINPVNCFLYFEDTTETPYQVDLKIPEGYSIVGSLRQENNVLHASNFQELADSPFIASRDIKILRYEVENVPFRICVQGEIPVDRQQLIEDHRTFTISQIEAFGSFPVDEYTFLYQWPSWPSYHGVEHEKSTVITYGPAVKLKEEKHYRKLLGIASHELYHTWNVKHFRPTEMTPYDFKKENYSRLGFVMEGVTTYLGDQFLWRSGLINDDEYFSILGLAIERHIHNDGRLNHSVAESSFDTWLDGYELGIPGRKVSIYNEGCLISLILDLSLITESNGEVNLDRIMKDLYSQFGSSERGYTEDDFWNTVGSVSSNELVESIRNLVENPVDYFNLMNECVKQLGLEISLIPNPNDIMGKLGLKLDANSVIRVIHPESPCPKAGLWLNDQIVQIEGISPQNSKSFKQEKVNVKFKRHDDEHWAQIRCGDWYFPKVSLVKADRDEMPGTLEFWKNRQ